MSDRSWMTEANCLGLDPTLFFPERGRIPKEARDVCAGCDVKSKCLDYSLDNGEYFGVWGGVSERERRSLRRKRSLARPTAVSLGRMHEEAV